MIAMKYGTVPIVRGTGGLVNTVFDVNLSEKPFEERNGYVFYRPEPQDLEAAMHAAASLWYSEPDVFRKVMINGMKCDYSWNYPAHHYLNIYEFIREK
jgi:starch synthase